MSVGRNCTFTSMSALWFTWIARPLTLMHLATPPVGSVVLHGVEPLSAQLLPFATYCA